MSVEICEYRIVSIRTNDRNPGVVYADIETLDGELVVSATLEYCADWIRKEIENEKETKQ